MKRNLQRLDTHPELGDFLKAVASETRQKILFLFVDGEPKTVGEIAEQLKMVPSTASEHLTIMKRGGLVSATRKGKEVYYRPDRAKTLMLLKKLTSLLSQCCPD
ncbi:MAG TPA: metalloregulator ArsR/SmtB family transcription factor [Polyangiaceae bacterium]|nr:metalloregulator ArsR/SmtB family transcription factor [Polyangiaceae bacterium]